MERDIYLYGIIKQGEKAAAATTARLIRESQNYDVLRLHINSPGGDVFAGLMLYDLMKSSKVPVDVYIEGLCASIASFIALAGRKIYIERSALMMIHAPICSVAGKADAIENAAVLLHKVEGLFEARYSERTGKTAEEVRGWLKGDNWFTAEEAKGAGLVDEITASSSASLRVSASLIKTLSSGELIKNYRAILSINNKILEKTMGNPNVYAVALGMPGESEESSVLKKISALAQEKDSLAAAVAAGKVKVTALEKTVAEFKTARVTALVDGAIAAKKITAQERNTYLALAEKDAENVEKILAKMQGVGRINAQINQPVGVSAADWDTLEKQGKLLSLKQSQPEVYAELYNTKFGV
ncbi:MAG: Clp protease ClpP [Dysgonamonadaceae bacterium]|jgi:ATP-dependent Clp endopeptidase proteolytic subunit ClpP|nr:Clp protease ClpP [Dysgonamonadaceae bacterium]